MVDEQYLSLVDHILTHGKKKGDRTGTGTTAIFGYMIKHNMKDGFPLLTTKKMYHKGIRVELEGFLKGITDKRWYQERGCTIWDEWANPEKAPYGHDENAKQRMLEERDLGPFYGFQWRHFNAPYNGPVDNYERKGVDQLRKVVDLLKEEPNSRRMIMSAWNPQQLHQMALEPCHVLYQADVIDGKLNLGWYQRSIDVMLGLPFNIASSGFLLHLLALESGFEEGELVGLLGDTHIYNPHIEGAREQLKRKPYELPIVVTTNFGTIFNWKHNQTSVKDYKSHAKLDFQIAV